MPADPRIAIVGPGAVAGLLAWHLARAGQAPTLVARPATAAAIAREGLTLVGGPEGGTQRVAATSDPQSLGPQDVVLVGFKAHGWLSGLDMVLPLVGRETVVVPMLNGIPWWFFQGFGGRHKGRVLASVDPEGKLAAAIDASRLLGCVVYVAAQRETPARISWNGRRRLVLGEPAGAPSERLRDLVALLRATGFEAQESADIRRDVWLKLFGNVTYNPLSVVTGAAMGRMATRPPLRRILRLIMEETLAIGRALGVVGDFDIEERLRLPAEMHEMRTSMLQDYDAGRGLELGAIVDAVVELGELTGVATPMIAAIGALAQERWERRWGARTGG